jgi:hypothetical protein
MNTKEKIQAWLEARDDAEAAEINARRLLEEAETDVVLPDNLRAAVAKDIQEDAVIWYPRVGDCEGATWAIVYEPLYYGDAWKAFTAHDGCRLGLHGAFVEDEK